MGMKVAVSFAVLVLVLLPMFIPMAGSAYSPVLVSGFSGEPGFERVVVSGFLWFAGLSSSREVLLATGYWGLKLYRIDSWEEEWVFRGTPIYGAALDDDRSVLVVLSWSGLEAYNASSGELLWVNTGIGGRFVRDVNRFSVVFMEFSRSGFLALVSREKLEGERSVYTLYVVGRDGGILYSENYTGINGVAWSPVGDFLAYTSSDRLVVLSVGESGVWPKSFELRGCRGVAWSLDGGFIGVATIYSATGGNWNMGAKQHLIRLLLGMIFMLLIAMTDIRVWFAMAYPGFIFALILLPIISSPCFIWATLLKFILTEA